MTRTTATLAVAADYADALITARRAKNWLFFLLLIVLLAQIVFFALVRFNVVHLNDVVSVSPPTGATVRATASTETDATQPSTLPAVTVSTATATPPEATKHATTGEIVSYVTPVFGFLGITFAVVLAVVLVLLTGIMLVGRLIGVSHVTSAFIWSVLLAVFLFPWQAFLIHTGNYSVSSAGPDAAYSSAVPDQPAFKIPGVLYTYPELKRDIEQPDNWKFSGSFGKTAVLKWTRYGVFPLVALIMLLMIQAKSSRGLRFALGEAEVQVEVTSRPGDPLV